MQRSRCASKVELGVVLGSLLVGGLGCSTSTSSSNSSGGAGGQNPTGGVSGSGGETGSGGSASGGRSGSGGASSAGGVSGSGGTTALGSGGQTGQGGASSAGGAPGTGGITASASGGSSRDGAAGPEAGGLDGASTGGFDPCPASGTCKILPLGDSITAGAGAQPGDGGGYRVELFTKAIGDSKHITFVGSLTSGPSTVTGVAFPQKHEGHIGWTITQVSGIATTSQALKDMPQIVLLFIGTNDEGYANTEAGASDRLGQLIDKIVAALPDSLLVVSSIYPFPGCKATNYTPAECAVNVATYDAAIPGVIKQRADQGKHVIYVDMSTPPSGALSTDGVHPNDTVGYPWMGDTWYAAIKAYLH
jgi:lysophospholipase L1-like esterase